MDAASISALSVVGGSLVGALTSLASTWLTQQQQDRRELLGKQVDDREMLYADFIAEASRAVVDSLAHGRDRIDGLIPFYALFGHIRLSSSEALVTAAEKVITEIIAEYFRLKSAPMKVQESTFSPKGQHWADPLKDFSHVCREELRFLAQNGGYSPRKKRLSGVQKSTNQMKSTP